MRIAINTVPLSGGHSARGIGLYTKELIDALGAYVPELSLSFFTQMDLVDPVADIVHFPFFDPFFLTMPWRSTKPVVVTVHDLIPIVYSDHFPRGIRGEIKWRIQKYVLTHTARVIVTDSDASKKDIGQVLGFPSSRIFSVPLASRAVFRPVTSKKTLSAVANTYGITGPFLLYVGDVNWNKNVLGLLEAYKEFVKTQKETQLVLVGKAFKENGLKETDVINRFLHDNALERCVITPGFVPDGDLSGLYSLAQACVYPSFVEGFGFPVLEAMACGCPVVTSDVPSLKEIAGPSVLVVPQKPHDILRGLQLIVSMSSARRQSLKREGIEWSERFNWKRVALDMVRVYEKTLNHRSGL